MAWELTRPVVQQQSDKPKLCIGLPHTGMTSVEWAVALASYNFPKPFSIIQMTGQPVDKARNLIAREFLKTGAPWLLFIDTDTILGKLVNNNGKEDVVFDPEAPNRMISRNVPILSGVYYRRSDPPVPGIYKYFPDMQPAPGHRPIMEYPMNQLFPVDAVGGGCLLIHRSVFEKVPRPWFLFGDVDCNEFSEDFAFNHKCDKYGIKTIIDPSVQCMHLLLLKVSRAGVKTANV